MAANAAKKTKVTSYAERRMIGIIHTRAKKAARFLKEQAKKLGSPEMEVLASHITHIEDTSSYRSVRAELRKVVAAGASGLQVFCAEQQNKTKFEIAHIQGQQKKAEGELVSLAQKADSMAKQAATLQAVIATSQRQLVVVTGQQAAEVKKIKKVNRTSTRHKNARKKSVLIKAPKMSKGKIDLKALEVKAKQQNEASEALLKKLDSQMQAASQAAAFARQERKLETTINAKEDKEKENEKRLTKMKATLVEQAHAYQGLQRNFANLQQFKKELDQKCVATSSQQQDKKEEEVKALHRTLEILSSGETA